ncbi:MAG: hypothetical protein MUO76_18555, partial [Anaerolineaceae bacterium]|nr:hypothetical protein [Anaerolineaceae bacterium]
MNNLWRTLVEPPESMTQLDKRRQSRLLSSILAILLPFALLMSFGYEILEGNLSFFQSSEVVIAIIALGSLIG